MNETWKSFILIKKSISDFGAVTDAFNIAMAITVGK